MAVERNEFDLLVGKPLSTVASPEGNDERLMRGNRDRTGQWLNQFSRVGDIPLYRRQTSERGRHLAAGNLAQHKTGPQSRMER